MATHNLKKILLNIIEGNGGLWYSRGGGLLLYTGWATGNVSLCTAKTLLPLSIGLQSLTSDLKQHRYYQKKTKLLN